MVERETLVKVDGREYQVRKLFEPDLKATGRFLEKIF